MTILLQTRVDRELAARFRSAAKSEGKSTSQALRELAERYANHAGRREFACNQYGDRFRLPAPGQFKQELRSRMRNSYERHH